jgi:hypothetical protein
MDASADVIRNPGGDGTLEGVEPGSLLWARQHIEEVKAGLRDDPGRAYSVHCTAAAETLRERDPVQFHSLRRLLKDKLIRLGEFDLSLLKILSEAEFKQGREIDFEFA